MQRQNFFESPHPISFNYHNDARFRNQQEHTLGNHSPFPIMKPSPYLFYSPKIHFTPTKEPQTINRELNIAPYQVDKKLQLLEDEEQQLQFNATPRKNNQIISSPQPSATASRKYELRSNGSARSRKTIRENQRGLRVLSKIAYQIVLESGPTTYRQVSDKLIAQQSQEHNIDVLLSIFQQKQRQNIKRRVYDALNVLIALGELDKKGRKIVKSRKREKKEEEEYKLLNNKEKLVAKLNKKKLLVQRKNIQRQRINKIYKVSKKLFNRNQKDNIIQESDINVLKFPFLFTMLPFQEVNLSGIEKSESKVTIPSEQSLIIKGEVDVISMLPYK